MTDDGTRPEGRPDGHIPILCSPLLATRALAEAMMVNPDGVVIENYRTNL